MTSSTRLHLTYLGGPTALLELGATRLLTDPTLDEPGQSYEIPRVGATTRKLAGPALPAEALGRIDVVLLSHDEHADNLDQRGRELLVRAPLVATTPAAAQRLGGTACGLAPWQQVMSPDGQVRLTATPGRHGPEGCEPLLGEVTGFVLESVDGSHAPVYISGDTVFYEGIREIGRRFRVGVALLNVGRVEPPGGPRFTMAAEDAVETLQALGAHTLVPLHYEGWAHFTEDRAAASAVFERLGVSPSVRWLEPGVRTDVDLR